MDFLLREQATLQAGQHEAIAVGCLSSLSLAPCAEFFPQRPAVLGLRHTYSASAWQDARNMSIPVPSALR